VNQIVAFATIRYESAIAAALFVCPHVITGELPNYFKMFDVEYVTKNMSTYFFG
jgi:hypothetical protein